MWMLFLHMYHIILLSRVNGDCGRLYILTLGKTCQMKTIILQQDRMSK